MRRLLRRRSPPGWHAQCLHDRTIPGCSTPEKSGVYPVITCRLVGRGSNIMNGERAVPIVMIRAVRRFEERLHRAFHYGYGARTSLRTSVRRLDDRFTEAGVSKDSIRWLVRYVTQHEVETHSSGRTVYFPNADSL